MNPQWRRVERLLQLARLAREEVFRRGDSEVGWSIAALATDTENEARDLAALTNCLTHMRLA